MIYVNLFVQSNGVVAYSKLLGIWNDIYEIFFSSEWIQWRKWVTPERKEKKKKTPHSEVETAGQVRGCVNSPHTQGNMFSCDSLII